METLSMYKRCLTEEKRQISFSCEPLTFLKHFAGAILIGIGGLWCPANYSAGLQMWSLSSDMGFRSALQHLKRYSRRLGWEKSMKLLLHLMRLQRHLIISDPWLPRRDYRIFLNLRGGLQKRSLEREYQIQDLC